MQSYVVIDPGSLRKCFQMSGLTLAEVARHLKIHRKTVQRWVNGHVTKTSTEIAEQLGRLLSCRIQDFARTPQVFIQRPTNEILQALLSPENFQIYKTPKEMVELVSILQRFKKEDLGSLQDARLQLALGYLHYKTGSFRAAHSALRKAVEIARGLNEPEILIRCYSYLSAVLKLNGKYREALALLDKAEALMQSIEDPNSLAEICYRRAIILLSQGDLEQGEVLIRRSLFLELRLQKRSARGPSLKYILLARINLRKKRLDKAYRLYHRAGIHSGKVGSSHTHAISHYGKALVYLAFNDPSSGQVEIGKARNILGRGKGITASQKFLSIEFAIAFSDKNVDRCRRILHKRYGMNRHSPPLIVDTVKQAILLERVFPDEFQVRPSWIERAQKYLQNPELEQQANQLQRLQSLPKEHFLDFSKSIEYLVL